MRFVTTSGRVKFLQAFFFFSENNALSCIIWTKVQNLHQVWFCSQTIEVWTIQLSLNKKRTKLLISMHLHCFIVLQISCLHSAKEWNVIFSVIVFSIIYVLFPLSRATQETLRLVCDNHIKFTVIIHCTTQLTVLSPV